MRTLGWIGCALAMMVTAPVLAQRQGASTTTQDPLAQALQKNDVFVGKTLRSRIDSNALLALTRNAAPDRPLKIAVVNQLPASGKSYGNRDTYTKALHDWLGLGRGTLLIRTQHGVSAATDALPAAQITQILQQHTQALRNDPVEGIRQTVSGLDAAVMTQPPANGVAPSSAGSVPPGSEGESAGNSARSASGSGDFIPFLVLFAGMGLLVVGGGLAIRAGRRALRAGQAAQQARQPIRGLHNEVVTGIAYADTYLDLLPDSPEATQARNVRAEAARLLEQSSALSRGARTAQDWERIEALLEQARTHTQACRNLIDKATGGTGMAVAVDGTEYKATPAAAGGIPATQAAPVVPGLRIDDIPANERAACFFCSRPARISELTPITIAVNGQRRKVLACADDVRIIQHGATPQVRTVSVGSRRVPWYTSSSYNPYRDYYGPDVVFVPGYGYDDGVAEGFLFGTLMAQPYPVAYPVFIGQDGVPTNDYVQAAPPIYANSPGMYGVADNSGVAGSDDGATFQGADPGVGGIDWQGNADPGGAADFSSNDNSTDFGSASGGTDFGSGSSDFSSSSSDFGGGGSDFGGGGGDY